MNKAEKGVKQCCTAPVPYGDPGQKRLKYHVARSQVAVKPYKWCDGKLYDAIFRAAKPHAKEWLFIKDKLEAAFFDKRITKRFRDVQMQRDALKLFLEPDVPSKHYLHCYKRAVALMRKLMRKGVVHTKLKALDINEVELGDVFSNPNSNIGYSMPGAKKRDYFEEIRNQAKQLLVDWSPNPVILFHRAQISGYVENEYDFTPEKIKYKSRVVSGMDAPIVLLEMLFVKPIMNWVITNQKWYAGGKDPGLIEAILESFHTAPEWCSIDFKRFDQMAPSFVIRDAFNIIGMFFPDLKDRKLLDKLEDNFINTWIIDFDGNRVQKHKGIPSGSGFTQLVGSLVNAIVVLTYLLWKDKTLDNTFFESDFPTFMVMGDDNVIFTKRGINQRELAAFVANTFGMTVDIDNKFAEGSFRDYPEFLKRKWTPEGGYRSNLEVLINGICSEYDRSYEDYSPYHILYGYFLTYKASMKKIFDEWDLIRLMEEEGGGISKLRTIKLNELPGSLQILAMDNHRDWERMITRAEKIYSRIA